MDSYDNFPPFPLFKRVLQSFPDKALLYVTLWSLKPSSNYISVARKDVRKRFFISHTLFRNNLLYLVRIDLLTFEEVDDFFIIQFITRDK